MRIITNLYLLTCLALFGVNIQAIAEPIAQTMDGITYEVPLNKSKLIRFNQAIGKVTQSNPKIASFKAFPPNEILLQGKSLGTTNLYVWGRNNKLQQLVNVEVTHDLKTLREKLYELLPNEQIDVRSSQLNIVLSGQVSGLDKLQSAIDIAQSFLPQARGSGFGGTGGQAQAQSGSVTNVNVSSGGQRSGNTNNSGPRVINMLGVSGAHQVMLEVKVAEIDRSVAKGLKVQFNAFRPSSNFAFGALNGGGSFIPAEKFINSQGLTGIPLLSNLGGIVGPEQMLLQPNAHSVDAAGLFLSAISGDFIFNLTIDAAKDQNLAKILAEPTLTTMSGQEATFLSGGEFPIPVPQSNTGGTGGGITIEFKEFGIGLRFLPVVLDSGRINLNMNVSVSELSAAASIVADAAGTSSKFSIPSLTKREASSTLELADGQTMSIAGLISDSLRENVDKFPGLGDVPVLGALFRSEKFLKEQSELMIFVTPRLAKPILPHQIKLPTDSFVEPDDIDFYLLGKLESRNAAESLNFTNDEKSLVGMDGQFGHELSGEEK